MDTRPGKPAYNPPPALTNNTPSVDPGVNSLEDLVNVSTFLLVPPFLKVWRNAADQTLQSWTLQADGYGLLPADYDPVNNIKSWHQSASRNLCAKAFDALPDLPLETERRQLAFCSPAQIDSTATQRDELPRFGCTALEH